MFQYSQKSVLKNRQEENVHYFATTGIQNEYTLYRNDRDRGVNSSRKQCRHMKSSIAPCEKYNLVGCAKETR